MIDGFLRIFAALTTGGGLLANWTPASWAGAALLAISSTIPFANSRGQLTRVQDKISDIRANTDTLLVRLNVSKFDSKEDAEEAVLRTRNALSSVQEENASFLRIVDWLVSWFGPSKIEAAATDKAKEDLATKYRTGMRSD